MIGRWWAGCMSQFPPSVVGALCMWEWGTAGQGASVWKCAVWWGYVGMVGENPSHLLPAQAAASNLPMRQAGCQKEQCRGV